MALIDDVQALYRAEDDEWEATETLFPLWFDTAITNYTLFRPQTRQTVIETVAEQNTYALPDETINVLQVEWYPDDIPFADKTVEHTQAAVFTSPLPYSHLNHLDLQQQLTERHLDRLGGWYVLESSLVLIPTPSRDGIGIYVEYTIPQTQDTIPTRHAVALKDFVMIEMLKRRAAGHAGKPDMSQGITKWVRRYATPEAERQIKRIEARAIATIIGDDLL